MHFRCVAFCEANSDRSALLSRPKCLTLKPLLSALHLRSASLRRSGTPVALHGRLPAALLPGAARCHRPAPASRRRPATVVRARRHLHRRLSRRPLIRRPIGFLYNRLCLYSNAYYLLVNREPIWPGFYSTYVYELLAFTRTLNASKHGAQFIYK